MKIGPHELADAKMTNAIAEEMTQALYDRLGMVGAIVVCIAMMAILLHSRAKQRGGDHAFTDEVKKVANAIANAPDEFAEMLNTHGHPDADITKKPN